MRLKVFWPPYTLNPMIQQLEEGARGKQINLDGLIIE
jgi:hypothetical protein